MVTQNETVNKILDLINSSKYTSEFNSGTISYNNESFTLPTVNQKQTNNNLRIR